MKNWQKVLVVLGVLIFVMANPLTRQLVLWILPLGSGIDDLVFFVLLLMAAAVILIRVFPVKDKSKRFVQWFFKEKED